MGKNLLNKPLAVFLALAIAGSPNLPSYAAVAPLADSGAQEDAQPPPKVPGEEPETEAPVQKQTEPTNDFLMDSGVLTSFVPAKTETPEPKIYDYSEEGKVTVTDPVQSTYETYAYDTNTSETGKVLETGEIIPESEETKSETKEATVSAPEPAQPGDNAQLRQMLNDNLAALNQTRDELRQASAGLSANFYREGRMGTHPFINGLEARAAAYELMHNADNLLDPEDLGGQNAIAESIAMANQLGDAAAVEQLKALNISINNAIEELRAKLFPPAEPFLAGTVSFEMGILTDEISALLATVTPQNEVQISLTIQAKMPSANYLNALLEHVQQGFPAYENVQTVLGVFGISPDAFYDQGFQSYSQQRRNETLALAQEVQLFIYVRRFLEDADFRNSPDKAEYILHTYGSDLAMFAGFDRVLAALQRPDIDIQVRQQGGGWRADVGLDLRETSPVLDNGGILRSTYLRYYASATSIFGNIQGFPYGPSDTWNENAIAVYLIWTNAALTHTLNMAARLNDGSGLQWVSVPVSTEGGAEPIQAV